MTERLRGDNVLLQMFRTGQGVRDLMLRAVGGTGVSPDEYAVLSVIAVLRAVSPTELATRLRIPPTSISRYIARLVDAGLAVRAPNPSDSRSYLLELTPEGRAIVRRVAPRIRRIVQVLRAYEDIDDIEAALVRLERAVHSIMLDDTSIRE